MVLQARLEAVDRVGQRGIGISEAHSASAAKKDVLGNKTQPVPWTASSQELHTRIQLLEKKISTLEQTKESDKRGHGPMRVPSAKNAKNANAKNVKNPKHGYSEGPTKARKPHPDATLPLYAK